MRLCERCGACFDDDEDACAFDGHALSTLFPGPRVVGGRYLLEQRVAAGAMGVVVRATHLQVGSTVAVKLMQPAQDDRHVALARFQREAQILGRIKHPNAVLVMDFGVEQRASQAVPYLVMEYLRGESLLSRLERRGRLTLEECERVFTPLCEAVEEAHAAGVIHRDLKPSNVVLERLRDGSEIVKVLDFGIAKFIARGTAPLAAPAPVSLPSGAPVEDASADSADLEELGALAEPDEPDELDELVELLADDEDGAPTLSARGPRGQASDVAPARDPTTEAGFMIGTVPYMAPEQMAGGRVSRRTDVHAVAVMIFQCLAGRLPYAGDDDDVVTAKLSDERPTLREHGVTVPGALDEALRRSFAREPAERPAAVRELALALREAAESAGAAPSRGPSLRSSGEELDELGRALLPLEAAVRAVGAARAGEDHYARARDLLLRLDVPLGRARAALERAPATSEARAAQQAGADGLAARLDGVRRALAHLEAQRGGAGEELAAYLRALWGRLDGQLEGLLEALLEPERGEADTGLAAARLFSAGGASSTHELERLAERLLDRDPLDGAEALEEVLAGSVDAVVAALGASDALASRLVRALWAHADSLLLHELAPGRRGFRLLPFLASQRLEAAAPFAALAGLLSRADARAADLSELTGQLSREDAVVLMRCALLHPSEELRAAAASALEPAELWNVIAHPATPLGVLRFLFEHLPTRARSEYLKVFFFCVRDHLQAATHARDVQEALALIQRFFQVACFHEDIVFEPLLELEAALRARAAAARAPLDDEDAYAEALATFTARGATETRPLESLIDVPLPIQRKLAREGHFVSFFVSHQNERVARETVPHLLRLEDVTPYLHINTIHRVVLTELAKRKRFFRKDAAKLALLQNPRTPALVARGFIPVVSSEQLRLLATNRHINPDVRRLIAAAVGLRPGPA